MIDGLSHFAFIGPGGPEILVVMLVLLLLFGAKDAPRIFRKLNEIMNQLRSTTENFKHEVMYGDLSNGSSKDDDFGLNAYENADAEDTRPEGDEPASNAGTSDEAAESKEEGGDVPKV